ncbi:5-formyltetrahydrofolate cyclo-ligase [Candidatus Litorirhabdus singularis]|uniref:5-formyltetrahydrofolate cyclo-ligase n=1 Tax=Candidatus Litorirhabdus singularis TaxID=2518993 RepID=UPI00243175FF|nr:5-formyltetrahydrofolate cyclo-ligase [Candidatus Litorirhabdus singularis]
MTASSYNSKDNQAPPGQLQKRPLRRQLRAQRRALSSVQQAATAQAVAHHLLYHSLFRRARHVACYLASDGETDCTPSIRLCWRLGKQVYLPVTHAGQMTFRRYSRGDKLRRGGFNFLEPLPASPSYPSLEMDLVLTPLVGFTRQGERLGMGGGFYDRCFADDRLRRQRPTLLGLAHSFQQVETLPTLPHDRQLDAVVTDCELWMCGSRR